MPSKKHLFTLEKDDLKPFGYKHVQEMSESARHRALNKALKKIKPLSLYRKLVALAMLNKNQDPKLSKIFKKDSQYIKTTSAYKNRSTAKKGSKKGSRK